MLSDQPRALATAARDRRYLRIAQELLEAVNSRLYQVGERLPTDRELAVRFGVSRATVREALLVLELIGAVEASVGAGVFVASFTPQLEGQTESLLTAPADLIESRLAIEPIVAALCAERISPDALVELETLVSRAEKAAHDIAPFPAFLDLSLAFHSALASHCGNLILGEIVTQLVDVNDHPLWVLLNQSVLRSEGDRLAEVAHHRAILEAIGAHNRLAAERAMASHLRHLAVLIFGAADGKSVRLASREYARTTRPAETEPPT
jgi:DNA-binding FadR family transcriptional regulator